MIRELRRQKNFKDDSVTIDSQEGQDVLKSIQTPAKELSDEEKIEKAAKEKTLEVEIEKEQEIIASEPIAAIEEQIQNLDQDVLKALPEIVKEEESKEEFVEGNSWYDMAKNLQIGAWAELSQGNDDAELRCKLIANIKSLEKLIFVNKAGAKVAERTVVELAQELKDQKSKLINDNTIFDQALENVIVNLRAH